MHSNSLDRRKKGYTLAIGRSIAAARGLVLVVTAKSRFSSGAYNWKVDLYEDGP